MRRFGSIFERLHEHEISRDLARIDEYTGADYKRERR
jgi:hypothetical protein